MSDWEQYKRRVDAAMKLPPPTIPDEVKEQIRRRRYGSLDKLAASKKLGALTFDDFDRWTK